MPKQPRGTGKGASGGPRSRAKKPGRARVAVAAPVAHAGPELLSGVLPFPVVAIGASAGGLEAFTQLFQALPAAPGLAFVLVQHLDPSHESLLADLLARTTAMPVHEARDGQALEVNTVS